MLLGLSGKAGVGKDTVAQYLVEKYGFKRYAFADAVRDVALSIDPYVQIECPDYSMPFVRLTKAIDQYGWDYSKRRFPEVRRLLQVIGTEAGRMLLGENVWVDILARKWEQDGYPDAVITDFRFPNEHDFIENQYGVTIKILRPDNTDAISTTHASEQYDPRCEYVIVNNGSLDELYKDTDFVYGLIGYTYDG